MRLGSSPPYSMFHPLTLCPDGKTVLWFKSHEAVHLRDLATDKDLWHAALPNNVNYCVAFSPNGDVLALAESDNLQGVTSARPERAIRILDLATGRQLLRFGICLDGYASLAFSPDDRTLATGGVDHPIRIWEVATGTERRRLAAPAGRVSALVFAGAGETLISVNSDATALVWDLTGGTIRDPLTSQTTDDSALESHWKDLASPDADKAYRAVWSLCETPGRTAAFLKARLHPVVVPDPKRVAALINDLGSEQFAVRTRAAKELEHLGDAAESALREMGAADMPLEVKRRIDRLLESLQPPIVDAERLRALRAIEVLEHVAVPDARELLRALAKGVPNALVTREARASLQRLTARSGKD